LAGSVNSNADTGAARTEHAHRRQLKASAATVLNASAGFISYYNRNYTEAVKYFKKEPAYLLKNSYFNYIIANIYFKKKEYGKSLTYINSALNLTAKPAKSNKFDRTEIKYLLLKAKISANKNDTGQSASILKRILKKNPYNLKALLFLANLYIYKNDLKTAAFYLNLVKLNHPDNITAYYLLSKIYAARNDNKKAEKNLSELIKKDPYFKKVYFRLAAIYILSGKEKKAIDIFDKYLKINPDSKTALYQSAILEYALKNYKESRMRFKKFIRITAQANIDKRLVNNAYFFTGISYMLQKNYKTGIFYLNKIKPGRHYIDAGLQKIEIYINAYKKNGSVKYKTRIKKIITGMLSESKIKKSLKLYYFSAIALAEIKDYKMSEYVIKKGLLKFPDNTALLYELGSAYHRLNKEKKAYSVMKKILKINPYDADALNYLGYYLAVKNKNLKHAEILIKKALSYDKGSPFIIDSLGFVYYREKQYEKALKLFKIALKKLGKSATVLKHTGMDYIKLKDYKNALEYLKKSYSIRKSKDTELYIIKARKMD